MKVEIEGWIARDDMHSCPFLFSEKPEWDKEGWEYGSENMWRVNNAFSVGTEEGIVLPNDTFPELKRKNSPRKVKIIIETID